jgi:hypothetical protein
MMIRYVAWLAYGAAAASLLLLITLHFLKPDYDPSWRMVSEYAIGDYGWVQVLSFFALGLSCLCVLFAVRPSIHNKRGYFGLFVLFVTAFALAGAGLFPIDPITARPEELTTNGSYHGLVSMIGVPGLVIAALLISWDLASNPDWQPIKALLLASAIFTLLSLILMFVTIGLLLPQAGAFGPSVLIGWPNRILWLAYCLWLMTAAWRAAKIES